MPEKTRRWQEAALRLMRQPVLHRLMVMGINLLVPRQRIGVNLVAFDEYDRVLMLRHVFHPFAPWGLPGGWLKRNEAPETGLLRELREETGLTAVLGPVIRVVHDSNPVHVGIAYLGRVHRGPMTLSPEIIDAAWFEAEDLPSPLLPFNRTAIHEGLPMNRWWRETAVIQADLSHSLMAED